MTLRSFGQAVMTFHDGVGQNDNHEWIYLFFFFCHIEVSGYAVQHRLRKLKAIAKGAGDGSEPSTPAKAKANGANDVTKTPSPQKGTPKTPTEKKRRVVEKDEEDGVDDAGGSPKRVKQEASVRDKVKSEYA